MRDTAQRRAWQELLLATLAFAVCFAVWGIMAPLGPRFRAEYTLTAAQVGLLVAVPVLLGSVARIPLGLATDRFGGRVVFGLLLLFLLVPTFLVGLTASYSALLAAGFLLGMAGASFAVGVPFVSGWFPPERRGLALGIYGMGNIGTAVGSFLAPRLADRFGWPWAFWALLPALLLVGVLFLALGRNAPAFQPRRATVQEIAAWFRQPAMWVVALFYFVTFGGFVAIGVYLPTLLVSEYGLESADAGARAAGFIVLATLARPLGGYLADRWNAAAVLTGVFSGVAALAIILAFEPGMLLLSVTFLTTAFFLGLGNGAVFKLVADLFPGREGAASGIVGAAGGLGGFFPPLVLGAVYDITGAYAISFMLLSEFAVLCLLINLLAVRPLVTRLAQGHRDGSAPAPPTPLHERGWPADANVRDTHDQAIG